MARVTLLYFASLRDAAGTGSGACSAPLSQSSRRTSADRPDRNGSSTSMRSRVRSIADQSDDRSRISAGTRKSSPRTRALSGTASSSRRASVDLPAPP